MTDASAIQAAAIYAQAHLDEPLPLARLAEAAGYSEHHFHRAFAAATGETPAEFVQRLRLEKAAFRLLVEDETIINIALDCGYANHETMTRAFKRHFEIAPKEYRKRGRLTLNRGRFAHGGQASVNYELSPTRRVRLNSTSIAFIRSVGPYETVDPDLWTRLRDWSAAKGHAGERMLIGIGHDSPAVTAPEKLRFDACVTVPGGVTGEGDIRVGHLPALACGVTTHVGPYASLLSAYPQIFQQVVSLPQTEIVGLPAIELYRDSTVDIFRGVSVTDIFLPVKKI